MMTGPATVPRRPRPSPRQRLKEVWAVAADIPRFAKAPIYRGWHQRWGASDNEVNAPMPGDDLIAGAQYRATRAITRAGFYANDLLDNLGHPSARTILPEFQTLEIGQWVPMSPTPSDTTAFKVAGSSRAVCGNNPSVPGHGL